MIIKQFIHDLIGFISSDSIKCISNKKLFISSIKEWIDKNYPINSIEEVERKIAGKLTKPFGLKGYHRAEIGHIVYDENDRYVIYLTHDTLPELRVTFYKNDFGSLGQ